MREAINDNRKCGREVIGVVWISYLFISQDKVGIEEWLAFCDNPKLNDIHTKNQKDLNLPSRLIAKIFLFR